MASSTNRWLGVLAGIIAILFGLFALAAPVTMLASLVVFFGIFAIIQAVILLIGGIMAGGGEGSARWIMIGGAVIALILGVLALYNPTGFVIAIAFLIGIWMFVFGLIGIFGGIAVRDVPYWWLTLIAGIIGVIGGLYLLTQPGEGSIVLIWVLGIYAIVFGIERIVMSFYAPAPPAPVAI